MTSLLIELQTEELPPKALKKLSEAFAGGVEKSLAAQKFLSETTKVTAYGAPRRLACSNSSRTTMPAPSDITKPSRSLSNGRLA